MIIKEYRIPLPMTVEEYRIAQLYMIQVGGGAGVGPAVPTAALSTNVGAGWHCGLHSSVCPVGSRSVSESHRSSGFQARSQAQATCCRCLWLLGCLTSTAFTALVRLALFVLTPIFSLVQIASLCFISLGCKMLQMRQLKQQMFISHRLESPGSRC